MVARPRTTRLGLAVLAGALLVLMSGFAGVAQANVTQPQVTLSPPSAAASARTVYTVGFAVSSTGGLSAASKITITLPSDTNAQTLVNASVTDTTTSTVVGNCFAASMTVVTCGLFGGDSINPNDAVSIAIDGVTNPTTAAAYTLTVSTTAAADSTPVTSSRYLVMLRNPISQPQVTLSPPSAAASARTVYTVGFAVSSTGGLSAAANSKITITLPSDTNAQTLVNSSVTDTTTSTVVGNCFAASMTVVTCGLFGGDSINPNDTVSIAIDGVTNPTTAATYTLNVATTSDTTAVPSANYTVVGRNPITQPQVTLSPPSPAASARTVYTVGFAVSSTGGLSAAANSKITITLPSDTNAQTLVNSSVTDTTTSTVVGNCFAASMTVVTCGLFGGDSINPNDTVSIAIDGVTNPTTAATYTLNVATTSDTTAVPSANYTVVAAHQVTQPTLTRSDSTPSAGGVTYTVGFATSSTGGLSAAANSKITITLSSGTNAQTLVNSSVTDTTSNIAVGNCFAASMTVVTCGLFGGDSINPNDTVSIVINGVTNPPSSGGAVSISTTSDTGSVPSGPPTLNPPTVTGVSPSSGPAGGGTSVTITGTNLTGATGVSFGGAAATAVHVVSDTQITATSPPGSGTVDVTVTGPGGTSATSSADKFAYTSPPPNQAPAVIPATPTVKSSTAAAFSGVANPNGQTTTAHWIYGLDPSYRGPGFSGNIYDQSTPSQVVGSDASLHAVPASVSNLVPNALYHA